jgi:ATP-dependent Lhr-like helicase
VTNFDRLHPAIQHHIVNTLGWRQLRQLQSEAIQPVLQGQHALLLAPTAGGKTEAAVLPLMSRMTSENWSGLSLIYLCPIKALLNNLHVRLSGYMQLIGRRAAVWHGDVTTAERKRLLREPPDCLLTTPESLELMLVSSTTDERTLFGGLRAVVVDEIHAFAGDDRGWHLLCVLSRLSQMSGEPIQRIGLSATVGNPKELLDWFASQCPGDRVVVNPSASATSKVDITIDFVGSIENAAFVVSQLFRGEKRLVFCDSRSRAEQMAGRLRGLGVTTFVSHSSLSVDERRQAESAFAIGSNCVIVATSTLELGIDVGNLDRVIQLDAPITVRSFLQRLGRTGRREGSSRNCLFLATSSEALLNATGLVELWRAGYVEPTEPPPLPFHVLCQQLMALALQERGIARNSWLGWLSQAADLATTESDVRDSLVNELLRQDILWEDAGVLWFGRRGEKELGYRAFSELLSVFTTEPLLTVLHGPTEIGHLHPLSLASPHGQPRVVSLGGRSWAVHNVDWKHRTVSVEPSSEAGRSLWKGRGPAIGAQLCGAIRDVLTGHDLAPEWSRRASEEVVRLRGEHGFLNRDGTCLQVTQKGESVWWTFAGLHANDQVASVMQNRSGLTCRAANLLIEIDGIPDDQVINSVVSTQGELPVSEAAIEAAWNAIKFADYLPADLRLQMLRARLSDHDSVRKVLSAPPRWITETVARQ